VTAGGALAEPPEEMPDDDAEFLRLVAPLKETVPRFHVVNGGLFVPERGFYYDLNAALAVDENVEGYGVLVSFEGAAVTSPLPAQVLVEEMLRLARENDI